MISPGLLNGNIAVNGRTRILAQYLKRTLRIEAERSTWHNKKLCSFEILDLFFDWKRLAYPSLIGCISSYY